MPRNATRALPTPLDFKPAKKPACKTALARSVKVMATKANKAGKNSPIRPDGEVDDRTKYDIELKPARDFMPASLQRKLGLIK